MSGDALVSGLKRKCEIVHPQNNFRTALCFFAVALVLAPTLLSAQNGEGSNSRLERLRGGNIGMKFKWSGESFSGLGARADAMGGSISTLFPSGDLISVNPAGLGFARGFQITLDWAPPLKINPGGILGIENRINDTLLEAARNNNPPRDPITGAPRPDSVVVPADVNTELSMSGGLKGGAVMYGTPYFSIGAAFHQPLNLELQMTISGVEFLAAALDDQGKETNRIFGTINGNSNVVLNIESSTLAVASERLFPNLSVGLAYDSFGSEMNFESTILPEGIISSAGGDVRFFNDPARLQYDSLYANIKGNWQGSAERFRLGLGYHPSPHISLDVVVNQPFRLKLSGPFSMVHNDIRALNLNAGENEEVFDVDALVEDNLTKTQKIITRVPGIEFEMPGLAAVGFSARWGSNYVGSFVFTNYFNELAYRLNYTQFDSLNIPIKSGGIRQGIRLKNAYRLGIGVEPLILALGFVSAETFRETFGDDARVTITRSRFFIPMFSLGGSITFGHFRLDYIASFTHSSFLRFSTSYAFK